MYFYSIMKSMQKVLHKKAKIAFHVDFFKKVLFLRLQHMCIRSVPNLWHELSACRLFCCCMILRPEQLIKCLIQGSAYGDAKIDRRIIVSFFNRIYCLPRYADEIRQLLLRQVFGCARGFHFKILHQPLPFSASRPLPGVKS